MPSLPEMMFGDNILRIQHTEGYGIEFNAIDALKRVNNMEDAVKVVKTTERIDMEKLKAREQIMFFDEVLLFEDELHDHGVSMISAKIRVMPTSFFLLLRFFLRVDGVLIRINDTRLYHEASWFPLARTKYGAYSFKCVLKQSTLTNGKGSNEW
ncbi:hypothetical protein FQN60_000198 [Etheostoma spectabile]|uniref:TIP41-like protein n=1 Tax=Etheostoma spectabile TaxID=54343 RepID=A0A5J5CVK0_9PERO|nr:hypothetical protein FQN60_000198 [Etheostoma spectabile]